MQTRCGTLTSSWPRPPQPSASSQRCLPSPSPHCFCSPHFQNLPAHCTFATESSAPPPLPQVCLTHIQVSALLVIPLVLAFAAGCVGLWGRSGSIAAVAAVGGVAPASWFFFVSCAFGLVIPLVCFVLALANPCRRCCARPRCGCSGPITNSLRRRLLGRRRWSNPPLQRRRMAQRWRFRRSCKI